MCERSLCPWYYLFFPCAHRGVEQTKRKRKLATHPRTRIASHFPSCSSFCRLPPWWPLSVDGEERKTPTRILEEPSQLSLPSSHLPIVITYFFYRLWAQLSPFPSSFFACSKKGDTQRPGTGTGGKGREGHITTYIEIEYR